VPGQELSAQFFRSRLDNQFDGGPDFDDRTITVAETWQVASRNRLASFWVSRLSAGEGIDDSQTQTAYGNFPFKTTQRQYAWQNEFALPVGALTAGYERREERVATDAGFATTSRNTDSLFGIYQLRADAHALQANLRRDEASQYGGKTTGAIAYGYRFTPALRATAGYSTGFKAPSFNDLYYPGFANPDLVPETSRNLEAGIYWNGIVAGARIEARAIGYRNRVSSLIVFQCDASFNCAPYNVSRATLEGVTLGLEARGEGGATVAASLDLASPQDDLTGKLLPRRARQHGAVTAGYPLGPARVGIELVASSLRYDDPANLLKMGGYAIVNLTAEWALPHGVTLFARADNVFDKTYELAAGYGTGGAIVFAGVRMLLR
jgi:vitamin B12 transporter